MTNGLDTSGIPITPEYVTPDKLLTNDTLNKVKPSWDIFKSKLNSDFKIENSEIEQMEREFRLCLGAAEALNKGEQIGEWHFEENKLRYHDFDHTLSVINRTLQILPGFLDDLRSRGVDVSSNIGKIKGLIYGSIFHEIGYLKRIEGDKAYLAQGELYFDHVNRGVKFAPAILKAIDVVLPEGANGEYFFTRMIRATDFNMPWPLKEENEGLVGDVKEWGKVLEAADFLSAFAHRENIPSIVWDLYWEHLSRIVMTVKDGKPKVMRFQRYKQSDQDCLYPDWIGKIRLGKDNKPLLEESPDGENDYARIIEYKFGKTPAKIPPDEVTSQSLYEFVASNFLSFMQDKLEPYLKYADKWYPPDSNEIRNNYQLNIKRIETLKELVSLPEVDPLAILEGAFTGYDLHLWAEELKRKGLLDEQFTLRVGDGQEKETWHKVDRRVLIGDESNVIDRLVTREIRSILCSVRGKNDSRIKALSLLLERYRNKMQGENVSDVYMTAAPMAYVGSNANSYPFGGANEALDTFIEAVKRLKKVNGLPDIHLVCCIRSDKDFEGKTEEETKQAQRRYSQMINDRKKDLAGIAVFGAGRAEKEGKVREYGLESVTEVLDNLEHDMPVIALVGQTFPGASESNESKRKRFMENMRIYAKYSDSGKFGENMVLWGGQDISLLTAEEVQELDVLFAGKQLNWVNSVVYDWETGLVGKGEVHPLCDRISRFCDGKQYFATGNPVIGIGASSSVLGAMEYSIASGRTEDVIKAETIANIQRSIGYPLHRKRR